MKIGGDFGALSISAKGLSLQRKKMNLIAENIANADMIRTEDGKPYQRKYLDVTQSQNPFSHNLMVEGNKLQMSVSNDNHIRGISVEQPGEINSRNSLQVKEMTDNKTGEVLFMPDHPDADENGYVTMSNVNVISEMVDMIAATRSYEANLTAFNSSKQMAKDSLEI